MKIRVMIASTFIIASLMPVPGYAAFEKAAVSVQDGKAENKGRCECDEFQKDPIAALENRKAEILKLLDKGKISKEKADVIIKKLDAGIAEIKAFNKLTLDQKKAKLIAECKSRIELLVKDGKLDRKKADEIIKNYTEKIKQWDGTGYPKFFERGMKGRKPH